MSRLIIITTLVSLLIDQQTIAQTQQNERIQNGRIVVQETLMLEGTVASIRPGRLSLKDRSGKLWNVLVAPAGRDVVTLASGQRLRFPVDIQIVGSYPAKELQAGQILRFQGAVNRLGKTQGPLQTLQLVSDETVTTGIKVLQAARKANEYSECEIVGNFIRSSKGRLFVRIPAKNGFTRRSTLSFAMADNLRAELRTADPGRARAGAKVIQLEVVRLSTKDLIAKTLRVEINAQTSRAETLDERLQNKYSHLSDARRQPRIVRSPRFTFMTDISDRQAKILLDKLETMATLLTRYFGRGPKTRMEGFIVSDLSVWPEGVLTEPSGIAKIREGAGICFTSSLGNQRRATLYACDDHGVIQHECTHGFCSLTFGSTGPTWLAEGIAELGQYWKLGQTAVDINPRVLAYLQQAKPKKTLLDIAVPGNVPAGGWRDYAWRWALCHMLAHNPNYATRFKPLAIALMQRTEGVSFTSVYGPLAPQISFEYSLFLQHMELGYRADLCAWQWNTKFRRLKAQQRAQAKIKAAYSWQASGVTLQQGISYDLAATGTWALEQDGTRYDADGDDTGRGTLIGCLFRDYRLSPVMTLGSSSTFRAPSDGQLFLRCQDNFNALGDNAGEIVVHLRRSP